MAGAEAGIGSFVETVIRGDFDGVHKMFRRKDSRLLSDMSEHEE